MANRLDLTGKRFGRLTVMERIGNKGGAYVYWRCQCDCGKTVEVSTGNLRSRVTVSCGCWREEKARENLAGDVKQKVGIANGTNRSRIQSDKPQKNNKSGYRGVSWCKGKNGGGRWIAKIYAQGKQYYLGLYDTAEEANEAYKKAKEELHKPLVERAGE